MKKLAIVICLAFLSTAAARAQNLVVEFEISNGYRVVDVYLPADRNTLVEVRDLNLNRDGIPEVVMVRDSDQGTPEELIVVDIVPSPPEVLWTVDLSFLGYVESGFVGFFDLFSSENGYRAAVLNGAGGQGVQVFHPDSGSDVVFSLDADHRLLGVVDVDGDGLDELIVENTVEGVFQVWGASAAGRARR